MSISVIRRVLEEENLHSTHKFVFVALVSFLSEDDPDKGCWPSVRTLMRLTSLSDRTIHLALKRLEQAGYILRIKRPGWPSKYQVYSSNLRSSFGGGPSRPKRKTAPPTGEGPSLPPRTDFASTPEGRSHDQSVSKREKSDAPALGKPKRAGKARSIGEHLQRSESEIAKLARFEKSGGDSGVV